MAPETERLNAINHMKFVATGLLVLAAVAFVCSSLWIKDYRWLAWVRAFAEAAMVGALADWFAVTALFRHPLGIPIPHTAIIPQKKERIGDDLGNFIQRNFLSEKVINAKIDSFNVAAHFADWLATEHIAHGIADRLATALARLIDAMEDEDVRHLVERNLEGILRDLKAAPCLGNLMAVLWESDKERHLPELGLQLLEQVIEENENQFSEAMWHELPWYIPQFMRRRIFARILLGFKTSLHEMNNDLSHPLRKKINQGIDNFIEQLKTSAVYLERGEGIKTSLMSNPAVREYVEQLSSEISQRARVAITKDRAAICKSIARGVLSLGVQLQQDEQLQRKFNSWLKAAARDLLRNHRQAIVAYIADTMKMWDTKTVVNKIELQVGRDLQYIRLNGTIVGGLVGLLLHLFLVLLGN